MATITTTSDPLPSNAGTLIRDAQWGIDRTLTGWIILSVDWSSSPVSDTTQSQKGDVVSELDYDEQYTVNITVIGNGTLPEIGETAFAFPIDDKGGGSKNWKVDAVTENGSFNDKKKFTISAHRFRNFPA